MLSLELMTKGDCPLCDIAKKVIDQVIKNYPAELKLSDIEKSPELMEKYSERIPVLLIEGKESFVYKVHEITLRRKLDRALRDKEG
ncbi:MAG: glutaredoxin family protein [Candidatus Nitronauta litoralis]|uniref:Glutaredoxin family protein n=1 Tax=Candidatus Nitronauta litoralis TaxID=2705533 RepID=A0A7T0BXP8_9BACT|nr:MAG: glutaredoxin family protein [Candidatus Nitronauta litoralis]